MTSTCLLVFVLACTALAQTTGNDTHAKTASEIQATLQADLQGDSLDEFHISYNEAFSGKGASWVLPPAPKPPATGAGVVSAASLRHKVPKDARKAFERAQDLSKKGKYDQAAIELEKAIARDPLFMEAFANLGAQYIRLGRAVEAETALQRALNLDPASSATLSNMALAQVQRGNLREAERNARRALEISSINDRARYVLGYVLVQAAQTRAEGVRHLQIAARSMPGAKVVLEELRER